MTHRIHGLAVPGDPAVSPDGAHVLFTVSTIDVTEDRYVRVVWLAEGDTARPFTSGPGDGSARWAPDGRRIAFTRKQDDRPQVAVIPRDGGEASIVTTFPLGAVSEPRWSPDGSSIAVVGSAWRGEWAEMDDEERARRPRRIRRRDYRVDDRGWVHDRSRFIHLVDPEGGTARRLTDGDSDEAAPVWSPDGSTIAFLSDLTEPSGFRGGASILAADVATGEIREVAAHGSWSVLAYRPDGVLHALGSPVVDQPDHAGLWRFEHREVVCLTGGLDRPVFSFAAGPPRLVFDGDTAHVSLVDRGSVGLIAIGPDGGVEERVTGRSVVTGFDVAGGTTAVTVSTIASPGRFEVHGAGGTVVHDDLGGVTPDVVEPDHFTLDGPAGELDVWVYLPPGEEEVPLLLNIHGGPSSQYGWGFFDEFQVYCAAGYGVVATNPRGSTGRSLEFLRAVRGEGWGRVDVEDVDAVVAAALDRHPRLDPERMGVMGGSYGGFLTAWLIGRQDRWKAAIVERALLSWPSFAGTSDIGGWFEGLYGIDPDARWEVSALRLAPGVTTPTLVLHSEDDHRCPIEQAEQYFAALLAAGVETELVRFPGEGHELSRSGSPRHREERFDIVLEWLDRL